MPNAKIFMLISTVKRIFCVGPQRWAFSQQIVNRKDKRGSEGHTHEDQLCCLHLELELRRAVLVPQRILCSHHHGVAADEQEHEVVELRPANQTNGVQPRRVVQLHAAERRVLKLARWQAPFHPFGRICRSLGRSPVGRPQLHQDGLDELAKPIEVQLGRTAVERVALDVLAQHPRALLLGHVGDPQDPREPSQLLHIEPTAAVDIDHPEHRLERNLRVLDSSWGTVAIFHTARCGKRHLAHRAAPYLGRRARSRTEPKGAARGALRAAHRGTATPPAAAPPLRPSAGLRSLWKVFCKAHRTHTAQDLRASSLIF